MSLKIFFKKSKSNAFKSLKNKIYEENECSFKGETHMIGRNKNGKLTKMNFCGPGTKLEKRKKGKCSKPISNVDSVCKTHDYDYKSISSGKFKNASKKTKKKKVRKADKKMINRIKNDKTAEAKILKTIMENKIRLEQLGLIDRLQFIGNKGK